MTELPEKQERNNSWVFETRGRGTLDTQGHENIPVCPVSTIFDHSSIHQKTACVFEKGCQSSGHGAPGCNPRAFIQGLAVAIHWLRELANACTRWAHLDSQKRELKLLNSHTITIYLKLEHIICNVSMPCGMQSPDHYTQICRELELYV